MALELVESPPNFPSSLTPSTFATLGDPAMIWLAKFGAALIADWSIISGASAQALIAQAAATTAANAAGYASTCSTSVSLTTGAKSLTLQTGKAFPSASDHVAWLIRASDPTIRIKGKINPYNSGTGAATFTVASTSDIYGSGGPYTDWMLVSGSFISALATAAMVRAGTDATTPVTAKALMDALAPQVITPVAGVINWDTSLGANAYVTLTQSGSLAQPTNSVAGQWYTLNVAQNATGGWTLTYHGSINWGIVGPPGLSTGALKQTIISLYCITAGSFRGLYNKDT